MKDIQFQYRYFWQKIKGNVTINFYSKRKFKSDFLIFRDTNDLLKDFNFNQIHDKIMICNFNIISDDYLFLLFFEKNIFIIDQNILNQHQNFFREIFH